MDRLESRIGASVCVPTCFVVEGFGVCCSRIVLLGPLPDTFDFWLVFVFAADTAKIVPESGRNLQKLLLGAAP